MRPQVRPKTWLKPPPKLRLAVALALLVPSMASAAATDPARVVLDVHIDGKTLESRDRLLPFLGIAPGTPYATVDQLRERVDDGLKNLGYVKLRDGYEETPRGLLVQLSLQPAELVRHVLVHGNWPVFDDEIRRRLTLRPGSRLPPEPDRSEVLRREERRVRDYLRRDGYFEAEVEIVIKRAGRPEWTDLDVRVTRGRWFHLTDVEVEGATVIGRRDFLSFFGSSKPYWLGRLRLDGLRDDARDIEKEYRDRGYPAARVLPDFDPNRDLLPGTDGARLHVHVTEKQRVDIHFTGNVNLSDRQLKERVTIFAAGSYDDVELEQSARELARLYQQNGFLEARVTFSRRRTGAVEDVTFVIDEGPELKVRTVDFLAEPGAPPVAEAEAEGLRAIVITRPFPRIGEIGLGGGGYVTALQLAQDAERIALQEKILGCPDAKVRGELARDPAAFGRVGVLAADVAAGVGDGQDLFVRFYVDKGRCEILDGLDVAFQGPHTRTPGQIIALASLHDGRAFTPDALQTARKRLIDYFAAVGHPYAAILPPRLDWNADHTRVKVLLTVEEGPEVRFGEILIRGNFKTKDWVIRRNLPFKTGDLFDVTRLAVAERNLQTHAIFNGVRVIPFGVSRRVNPVPILVEIQQERYDDWGSLVLAAGYSTDVGLTISPGYYWGNVFGGGGNAEFRLEAAFDLTQSPSTDYSSPFYRRLAATLRYVHPHLVWPPLRAETTAFARKENTVRLGEIDSAGASVAISYVASPSFRLFGRYDWTLASVQSIPLQRLPGRNDAIGTVNDLTRTGKLTLGLVFDDRTSFDGAKNPLMPISGTLVAGSFAVAAQGLGGSDDFLILAGQLQRYQQLGAGFSIITNVRGDWGVPLGQATELPAVDRFYAGGDVATRGFETDKLLTEVYGATISPSKDVTAYRVVPRGGNVRLLGTIELQFPITKIAGFPLVGAIFSDAGTLFDSPARARVADIKVSVGLTVFRLLTPVGPISFEYAYPITQTIVEQEWKSQPWYRHWPGLIHFNWGIPILR